MPEPRKIILRKPSARKPRPLAARTTVKKQKSETHYKRAMGSVLEGALAELPLTTTITNLALHFGFSPAQKNYVTLVAKEAEKARVLAIKKGGGMFAGNTITFNESKGRERFIEMLFKIGHPPSKARRHMEQLQREYGVEKWGISVSTFDHLVKKLEAAGKIKTTYIDSRTGRAISKEDAAKKENWSYSMRFFKEADFNTLIDYYIENYLEKKS